LVRKGVVEVLEKTLGGPHGSIFRCDGLVQGFDMLRVEFQDLARDRSGCGASMLSVFDEDEHRHARVLGRGESDK
jgi:hypothetical protein